MRESSGLKKSYGNIWRYFYDKYGETVKRFTYEVSMSKIDKTGHSDI